MRYGASRFVLRAARGRRLMPPLLLLAMLLSVVSGFAQPTRSASLFEAAQWSASVADLPANRIANIVAIYSVESVRILVYLAAERGVSDLWTDDACVGLPASVLQDNRPTTVLAVPRNAFWLVTATADPNLDLCAFAAAFTTQFEALLAGSGRRVAFDRAAAVPEFPAFVRF